MERIYLDYSATTPLDPEVLETMLPYLRNEFGNPSSVHGFGRAARMAVEDARDIIANALGASPAEIVFTGTGTESDNLAILGCALANPEKGRHVITNDGEHHAVLHAFHELKHHGFSVTYLPVDRFGMVDPASVEETLRPDTVLISVMQVNNEVGTINPVEEIGMLARSRGVVFHTDAVQAFGKLPVRIADLNADLVSLSAHKLYGPKGVGALYVRSGLKLGLLLHGGGQERGRRAGTENVAAVVGFGKAAALSVAGMDDEGRRLTALRTELLEGLKSRIPSIVLNGHPVRRLPGNLNVSVPGLRGDEMVMNLDLEGIAVSTGSACTSGAVTVSHVLRAMGVSHDVAQAAVRITLGRYTTESDVQRVTDVFERCVSRMHSS